MKIINKILIPVIGTLFIGFAGCNKSNYEDGGTINPKYAGSMLDYLKAKSQNFDSLTKIIKLAGMESTFQNEEITFFAPQNESIKATINDVNFFLNLSGRDTIYRLEQVKPAVWKKVLGYYIFKHKKSLTDYPQVDFSNIPVFPGQPYGSYDGKIMNIGVGYSDGGGVQYAGARTLYLSYIPSASDPRSGWINAAVASSNIETNNGFIHALRYSVSLNNYGGVFFGFEPYLFLNEALDQGIEP